MKEKYKRKIEELNKKNEAQENTIKGLHEELERRPNETER